MRNHVSAVFDSRSTAEMAVNDLRTVGIADRDISIVTRNAEETNRKDGETLESSTGKGMAAGAGLGALFGLASAFIPGVGPFIAAGSLALTLGTVGASTVAGAVVGGTTGAISGALTHAGFPE